MLCSPAVSSENGKETAFPVRKQNKAGTPSSAGFVVGIAVDRL
jgi:hypothetical protein